jgi:hypothetical protein
VKLIAALAQHSYWFMGIHKDIDIRRGDIKALNISSSFAFPRTALRHMLIQAGIDVDQDEVRIVESLPSKSESHSLDGVKALQENLADGFWGNGMRLALAEKAGIAKLHLDLRRGDGPPDARHYNFAALAVTEALIEKEPQVSAAAAAVRAIVSTQKALKADSTLAKIVGDQLFPGDEADMIPILVARDAPFYDATITFEAIEGLNKFAVANGLLNQRLAYDQIAAVQFKDIWKKLTFDRKIVGAARVRTGKTRTGQIESAYPSRAADIRKPPLRAKSNRRAKRVLNSTFCANRRSEGTELG